MNDEHKIKENQDQNDLPARDGGMTDPAGTKGGKSDYSQTSEVPTGTDDTMEKDEE